MNNVETEEMSARKTLKNKSQWRFVYHRLHK